MVESEVIIYPNEENVFVVPNHEKKGDYYVNPCQSQLKIELRIKNGKKRSFSYETKSSKSVIPMRRKFLWFQS